MSYYDDWEYDIKEFLISFLESDFNQLNIEVFLKKFELTHYEVPDDVKSAKRALLVDGDPDYIISSTDLSWISERTDVLIANSNNRNLIFVDLDSTRDTYYLNSAAFIKVFNKAFPKNNCYIIKTCDGLAVGSMRKFNSIAENNFCITQLFTETYLDTAIEFLDELSFDEYDEIPATIIDYSPQERFEYVKPRSSIDEYDEYSDQIHLIFQDDPIIYTTYTEVCKILSNVANQGDISSFDMLEEALEVEEKTLISPSLQSSESETSLFFEEETDFSQEAYNDAELMLREMLSKSNGRLGNLK